MLLRMPQNSLRLMAFFFSQTLQKKIGIHLPPEDHISELQDPDEGVVYTVTFQ